MGIIETLKIWWQERVFKANGKKTRPLLLMQDGEKFYLVPDPDIFINICNEMGLNALSAAIIEEFIQQADGVWQGVGNYLVYPSHYEFKTAHPNIKEV